MNIIKEILAGNCANHIHPFTALSARDTEADVENRIRRLHEAGIASMDLLWEDPDKTADYAPFNSDVYWQHMEWVVRYCKKYGMTFMIQDAAPFPSGRADGWIDLPENRDLRKLYLAQRHLDVVGPIAGSRFRIDLLTGTKKTEGLFEGNGKILLFDDRLVAAVAIRLDEDGKICDTPQDISGRITDGILYWDVPDGKWRILSIYESHNGGGRVGFINLLDRDSVALQIQAVYEPHYQHLKEEAGKTWIGMFYDEPEVGNLFGHFFTQRVGTPQDLGNTPMDLPWSREARERWAEKHTCADLAYLWYDAAKEEHSPVRYCYMELISGLIRDNYNGQVHAWCRAHGIQYIGHGLEDENSHCRLSCGPVHYFRMQAHQDMGGIDMIGNQMIPGRDFTQAWYGSAEGDGEFYHYGLAKLASSAGHICPEKKGRSFCEIFAVYGALAGTRMRKSIMDHLFVNGITELIPVDPVFDHLDMAFSRKQNEYSARMCHLLTGTSAVIKTAVLYHAENEWYEGECMKFHVPGRELARHQISYDVIPADVFSQRDFYRTDTGTGLTVNENRYEALILPESSAIPACVEEFLEEARKSGFPVFYVNQKPEFEAETGRRIPEPAGECVSLEALAGAVRQTIRTDIRVSPENQNIRYAHHRENGDIYLLWNQGDSTTVDIEIPCRGTVVDVDMMEKRVRCLHSKETDTRVSVSLHLEAGESRLLCVGAPEAMAALNPEPAFAAEKTVELNGPWQVTLEDAEPFSIPELIDLGGPGLYPRYTGRIVYERTLFLEEVPRELDLGDVQETAELFINGQFAGMRMAPGYRFDTAHLLTPGENHIRIEVHPNQGARPTPKGLVAGIIESVSAAAYCPLAPVGLLGPVQVRYGR